MPYKVNNEEKIIKNERKRKNLSAINIDEELMVHNNKESKKITKIHINRNKNNCIIQENEYASRASHSSQKIELKNVSMFIPKKKEKNLDKINLL